MYLHDSYVVRHAYEWDYHLSGEFEHFLLTKRLGKESNFVSRSVHVYSEYDGLWIQKFTGVYEQTFSCTYYEIHSIGKDEVLPCAK